MWKDCFNSSTLRAMKFGKKRCEQLLDICNLCFSSYLSEDTHCLFCHQTFKVDKKNFDFAEHEIQCKEKRFDPGNARAFDSCLPLGIRLLTALLGSIEVGMTFSYYSLILISQFSLSIKKIRGKYFLKILGSKH
jgi:hypothetical protein